jgi:hypothetical protein
VGMRRRATEVGMRRRRRQGARVCTALAPATTYADARGRRPRWACDERAGALGVGRLGVFGEHGAPHPLERVAAQRFVPAFAAASEACREKSTWSSSCFARA